MRVALAAALVAGACAERPDNTAAVGDSAVRTDSALATVDSAPGTVLQGVAAHLSDGNVFALLDTTLAASVEMATLAQGKAQDQRVRALAARMASQHQLLRRGAVAESERLGIARVLPDGDAIEHHADRMRELRAKSAGEFDRAFVTHAVSMHEELLDEVDDAMGGATTESVRTFLGQTRANIEADLKTARALKDELGG
jgi:predicted outer membrane protein